VLRLSCGSHHTSVLLDDGSVWAFGIATDTKVPVHEPVCLIIAGIIDSPAFSPSSYPKTKILHSRICIANLFYRLYAQRKFFGTGNAKTKLWVQ
jgi:alpha-tubulin suppressor-like RCC1 family protein